MARKISFNTISQTKYDYLASQNGLDEGALYFTTDTEELYKGSTKISRRMVVVDDASEAPTDPHGNIIAEKDTFYVSDNGVIGAYLQDPDKPDTYTWTKFTAGNTLDVMQSVMVNGTATKNPVSGVAVREYVNNDTNKVYDGAFEIKNVTGEDGVTRKKAILTLKKVGNINNVELDLSKLLDPNDEEGMTEYYAKPILPSDLYYITAYNQTMYTHNMFEDPEAAKDNKLMLIARDDEGDVTHTYLDEYYTVYMQNEIVQNTFATTDNNGNEFTKKVTFHTSNPGDCANGSYIYQIIGDGLNAHKNKANRSMTGLMIDKLKGSDYKLTLSAVGTKASMETSAGWSLQNLVGMSNYRTTADLLTPPEELIITRDETAHSGLNATKNPFLKLSTDQDRTDHPDWCFTNTGSENEYSYDAENADPSALYYIFDYAWYLDTHGIKTPDIVTIAFGNDLPVKELDKEMKSLEIAVNQIKLACPDCIIGVVTPIAPAKTYQGDNNWELYVAPYIERLIAKVKDLQKDLTNIYLVPQYMFVDRNFNYVTTDVTPMSMYNDATKRKVNEGYILNDDGITEYNAALSAWLLNALPHTGTIASVSADGHTMLASVYGAKKLTEEPKVEAAPKEAVSVVQTTAEPIGRVSESKLKVKSPFIKK